jgi:serine/threonine-protein kinase
LDRTVALKVVSPELAEDPKFRDRFVRESRLAASLEHPSIVPIHDAGEADGVLYLAMRLVQGTDLKSLIAEAGGLDPGRTVRLLEQAAGALDAAHAAGLVHRDVKPGNVLVASPGTPGEHAYLSDFGLTKRMTSDSGLTGTGQFVGTLDYAAPEQFEGKQLDGRADVYSLGCVLYECLTGDIPFRRDNQAALVYAHLMAEPPKVTETKPDLPEAIDAVVARGMAKRPEERYETAGALVADAREALDVSATGRSGASATVAPPSGPGVARPRFPGAWVVVAAVVGVALVVGAVLLSRGGGTPTKQASTGSPSAPAVVSAVDRLVRYDPVSQRIMTSIPVGESPGGVTVGAGSVWITNTSDGTVYRIDPVSNKVTGKITVGKQPSGIAFDGDSIWVANELSNNVSRIDPATNEVKATISVEGGPSYIAAGDGTVLAGSVGPSRNGGEPTTIVTRIDLANNQVAGTLQFGSPCSAAVAVAEGAGWVATPFGQVVELDPASGDKIKEASLSNSFTGIAVGEGAVWLAKDGLPAIVSRVDPSTLKVERDIPVGTTSFPPATAPCVPISLATGKGSVWVTNADDGTVSQITTVSSSVVRVIDVGRKPTGVAFGLGALWVTVDAP